MIEKTKIALIGGNWNKENKSIAGTFTKLLKIILPLSSEVTCVIANSSVEINHPRVNYIKLCYKYFEKSFLKSSLYFILYQIKLVIIIIKFIKSKKVDIFIFCFGADLFFLPILFVRFFGKNVIIRTDSRQSTYIKNYKYKGSKGRILFKILLFRSIEEITYFLANRIVPESPSMVQFYDFEKYRPKLCIGKLYVEDTFKKNKKLDKRKYHVGYVGHFDVMKGVLEFAQSLHHLKKENINVKALFLGDGKLRDKLEERVYSHNIYATFVGWINKEKMPIYLNDMKLLVLPSSSEGLPNSIIEAMACGTLVLATNIGGIPDVIKEGETGFIMKDNSPECIAKNVMRALEHPNLERIVKNARELVEQEYTYEAAVERYRKILEELL